jgi:hypothetical protein
MVTIKKIRNAGHHRDTEPRSNTENATLWEIDWRVSEHLRKPTETINADHHKGIPLRRINFVTQRNATLWEVDWRVSEPFEEAHRGKYCN